MCTALLGEMHEDCERGWEIIAWLVRHSKTEEHARYIGTLFVEDFLVFCGRHALARLERLASTSWIFVEALRVVDWEGVPRDVRTALLPHLGQNA